MALIKTNRFNDKYIRRDIKADAGGEYVLYKNMKAYLYPAEENRVRVIDYLVPKA